ncbi:MAG: hypothetical protein ACI9Y7_002194 [Dokdonia sp.]
MSLQALGLLVNDSHDFCGIVYEEVKYSYRSGIWKFVVDDTIKIAEGPYNNTLVNVDDIGGCPYSYYIDSVDISKWSFWDLKDKRVQPNQRLKNIINSKDTIWSMINLNDKYLPL